MKNLWLLLWSNHRPPPRTHGRRPRKATSSSTCLYLPSQVRLPCCLTVFVFASPFCFCSGVLVQAGSASASEMRASRLARAGLATPVPTTLPPVCPETYDRHSGRTSTLLCVLIFVSSLTLFVFFLLQVACGGPARSSPDRGSLYFHNSCHSQATTQMYLSPPRYLYGINMGLAWYDSE